MADQDKDKPVLLIVAGCAGSGKTTIGKLIAKEKHWTLIDKDLATCAFTDYILTETGRDAGDRESDYYCNYIRPIEYLIALKLCKENLELGNSVVLTIPFISMIRDYYEWEKLAREVNIDPSCAKFIWIEHNEDLEYKRIERRNARRDTYKFAHWEKYCDGLKDIKPCPEYNAFLFSNDSDNYDINLTNVLEWLD